MNCDSRERLAGVKQLLPDCQITLTGVFQYLLRVKHEKGRRKMEDNKRNLCEGSILCFISKSNCQVTTQIKKLNKKKTPNQKKTPNTLELEYAMWHKTYWLRNNQTKKTWSIGWLNFNKAAFTKGKDTIYCKCRFMNDSSIYTWKQGYSYSAVIVSPTVSNQIWSKKK